MAKLSRMVTGHFMPLTELCIGLFECNLTDLERNFKGDWACFKSPTVHYSHDKIPLINQTTTRQPDPVVWSMSAKYQLVPISQATTVRNNLFNRPTTAISRRAWPSSPLQTPILLYTPVMECRESSSFTVFHKRRYALHFSYPCVFFRSPSAFGDISY